MVQRDLLTVITVTDEEQSKKYGSTQCIATVNMATKSLQRIYPVTPEDVKKHNIHRGAVIAVDRSSRPNSDKRIESVKVEMDTCDYIQEIHNGFIERYAESHLIGCSAIKELRPFKKPDPSFYFQRVHDVRKRFDKGVEKYFYKCQEPGCKGHKRRVLDNEVKELQDGDYVLLGRHSQEYLSGAMLVGILTSKR